MRHVLHARRGRCRRRAATLARRRRVASSARNETSNDTLPSSSGGSSRRRETAAVVDHPNFQAGDTRHRAIALDARGLLEHDCGRPRDRAQLSAPKVPAMSV